MERLQCSLGRLSIPGTTPPHQRVSVNELVPPDELQASFVREVCSDARLPAGAAHLACSAEEPALLAWGDGSQVHLQLDASRGVARTPATALPRDRCHAAGAVSALFFSAGSPPVLMVLAGEFASAYAVSLTDAVPSGSLVGRWKASRALRWRGAAWHPCVVDIAALMTQQELAIISMDSLIPEASCGDISTSSFTAASPEFQAMARLAAPRSRGIGPCALCWAEDGQTLVVSWGTTLELLRWPHGADPQAVADGGPTAWAEAACARRTLLLGLGEPLRCLASVPGEPSDLLPGLIRPLLLVEDPSIHLLHHFNFCNSLLS